MVCSGSGSDRYLITHIYIYIYINIFIERHNVDANNVGDGVNRGEPGGAAAGVHLRESARRTRASAESFAIRRDGGPVSQYVKFIGLLGKTASHAVDRVELCDSSPVRKQRNLHRVAADGTLFAGGQIDVLSNGHGRGSLCLRL